MKYNCLLFHYLLLTGKCLFIVDCNYKMSDRRTKGNNNNNNITGGSPSSSQFDMHVLASKCYDYPGMSVHHTVAHPELVPRGGCPPSKSERLSSTSSSSCRYDSGRTDSGFESIRSTQFLSGGGDSGVYMCSSSTELSGYHSEFKASDSDIAIDSGTVSATLYERDELDGEDDDEMMMTEGINKLQLNESRTNFTNQNDHLSSNKIAVDMEDPFFPDDDGDTVLHLAIIQMITTLVFKLIQDAPDIACLSEPNKLLQTPLHLAIITEQPRIVRGLVVAGADVNARDRRGNTALHTACERGNFEAAVELLKPVDPSESKFYREYYYPADLDLRNYEGKMCMHQAVLNRQLNIVKLLCAYNADLNPTEGTSGRTPLHYAVELQDLEMITFLVSTKKVDLNAQTYAGYTPIQFAYNRNDGIVMYLLQHGAVNVGLPFSSDSESGNSSSDEITEMDSDDIEFCLKYPPPSSRSSQSKIHYAVK